MSKADPLSGIFVADFSRVLAGPLCTQMLADCGARVVKIEEPGRGDETRRWGPPFLNGVSTYFLSCNRGKESLTLDLRSRDGKRIARELIERADVVVDNFLPHQRKALLGDVRRINRGVVHLSISGFDADSSEATTPGYDLLAQAGAGLMAITGEANGEPMKVGVALSDVLTAHHAFGAINAALLGRERTGRGARLEVSLHASTLASLVNVAQAALSTSREAKRYGNEHASIVPYQLFHGSDRAFAIGCGTDRHFGALCSDVIARPELAHDARFAANTARVQNRNELLSILQDIFATKRAKVWLDRCRRASVPASLVEGPLEALRSDAAGGLVGELEHPVAGAMRYVSYPVVFDGKRRRSISAPPLLGEHSDRILRELGRTRAEIARLRGEGVI